jgi:hypothetical protein
MARDFAPFTRGDGCSSLRPVRDPSIRDLPVQDTLYRDPEWEVLQTNPGAGPSEGHIVEWDPIHGYIRQTAPKVQVSIWPPKRPY